MSDKRQQPLAASAPARPGCSGDDVGVRQPATSNGHDVKFAVGAWLGAHADLRLVDLTRISCEWVTSDGNGNPDRAIVLHQVVESKASKTGERDDTVIMDNAALVRALLRVRAQRLSRSRLAGVSEALGETFHRAIALFRGPRETSALRSSTYGSLRTHRRSLVEIPAGSVRRQRWSCHQRSACSKPLQRFASLLVCDPARRLGLLAATLVASSTSSQLDVFCFVLCDSSDRMSKALIRKGELVLAICLEHGLACDVTCNDVRDLIVDCIHAG